MKKFFTGKEVAKEVAKEVLDGYNRLYNAKKDGLKTLEAYVK